MISCATKFPWHEYPFRLISWLEMEEFSARSFFEIACMMGQRAFILDGLSRGIYAAEGGNAAALRSAIKFLEKVVPELDAIACVQSARMTRLLINQINDGQHDLAALKVKIETLADLIHGEVGSQLLFWVPNHRSDWYGRTAESIVGAQCCARFGAIEREVQEATKCYAFGRYTAAVFHLGRASEAGVKAIALAIGFTPQNDNWTLVFRELGNQTKLPPAQRAAPWQTHGLFLEKIWVDLRAISKGWRNDTAHLINGTKRKRET